MTELFSSAQVQQMYNVTKSTVSRAAVKAGIPTICGRYVFTAEQLPQLAVHIHGTSGNPKFSEGNQEWKKRGSGTSKDRARG